MKKSFPVLYLPPDNSSGCPTAFVPWETENNQTSLTHVSMLFMTAKRLLIHSTPSLCPASIVYKSISPSWRNRFSDTEHIVCCRGLRTLVFNSKHIIMQNYRIIELGQTWKAHMGDSRTGHSYVTLLHLLSNLNLLFCDWSLLLLTVYLKRALPFLFPAAIYTFAKCC